MPAWRRNCCWRRRWRQTGGVRRPICAGATGELIYWHLTGGFEPGEAAPLFKGNAADIAAAVAAARDAAGRT